MMARISCSRTSKLMSVSAFTPPKASETFSTLRITSPNWRAGSVHAAFLAACGGKVFAARTASCARTVPVRPSSKRTCASTQQWSMSL